MSWWLKKPYRMVQTNLREIDANLEPGVFVRYLQDFSADVVLFNAGGIVANYPTELKFHYRNPFMKGDFLGDVIERTNKLGIRFIARFDFSKINESLIGDNRDWLYLSPEGNSVNYNGQLHTCFNSYYQNDYALEILAEVIDNYPIDGVFFNMIGYVVRDYSGNYHGICQCNSCQKMFFDYCGQKVPPAENKEDPVYLKYTDFQKHTMRKKYERICAFVKDRDKEIAICTYTVAGVDVVRRESNSGLERAKPDWNYSASDNVKSIMSAWDNKVIANAAVHFQALGFRHASVSPELNYLRLAENIAHAAWLDYYVIGSLQNQDDRRCFSGIRDIYKFYQENEKYYTDVQSAADVCLIKSGKNKLFGSLSEYRGIFRMLAESHILFDVIAESMLEEPEALKNLKKYKIIILPDMRIMSDEATVLLDKYVESGGVLVCTGLTGTYDQEANLIKSNKIKSGGLLSIKNVLAEKKGNYLRIGKQDKVTFKNLDDLDIIFIYGDLVQYQTDKNADSFLNFIPSYMYGPPEKCYYKEETDIPGILVNSSGKGKCITIPWCIGHHYQVHGNSAFKLLFDSILQGPGDLQKSLHLESSPLLEACSQVQADEKWQLVTLVNHSGQNGNAVHPPVPITDIRIRIKTKKVVKKVHLLKAKKILGFENKGSFCHFTVPGLNLFETIVLEFD